MKQTTKQIALVLSIATLAATSTSASAIDLRVIGAVTPSACTPVLGGGGTIDYGSIPPSSLSPTDYTVLPVMSTAMNITCDAPAKVAVVAKNGRVGTLAGSTEGATGVGFSPVNLLGFTNMAAAGLGLDGNSKIGGYSVAFQASTMLADGVPVTTIQKTSLGGEFSASVAGAIYGTNTNRYLSWAATGSLDPVAFTTLTGQLQVQAYLNKSTELDLSKPVNLDGLTTLELVYL
ncbi:DUF1120 domain-containing protein [Pseudomonas sp. A34-9]|uniref:DUF1120 domain-containing protein n=1 Tax=Pseudomonas sp. A34-9 TaxID=3034675 RepID=UPI00240D3507|nr:DUF1120 domain-containing protein [Pseudomonas sp. A34-9]